MPDDNFGFDEEEQAFLANDPTLDRAGFDEITKIPLNDKLADYVNSSYRIDPFEVLDWFDVEHGDDDDEDIEGMAYDTALDVEPEDLAEFVMDKLPASVFKHNIYIID